MNIEKQKEIADDVLDRMYLIDPYAIIAGGAPRDWYFNRLATDLDVFFYGHERYALWKMESLLGRAGFAIEFKPPSIKFGDEIYKRNPHLRHVFTCIYKKQSIHFLRMTESTFKCVVNEFPLNICKVWYKDGEIHTTKDFERAVKHKAIVKVNNLYANGDKYIQKILKKFPDFKFFESYEKLAMEILDK